MTAEIIVIKSELQEQLREIAHRARAAYETLAEASSEQKNMALAQAAMAIREQAPAILQANAKDVAEAQQKNLAAPMIDRLLLDAKRIEAMAAGLETIATIPDPVNKVMSEWARPNGLTLQRVSVPLGVIGIIYESRPNVTADAAGLCIKSGNAAILRGGSESFHSASIIVDCIHHGLKAASLPQACVHYIATPDRMAVGEMLKLSDLIDVIIPRGGKSLTQRVMEESRIPTILHLDGNCHTYVHAKANAKMAEEIVLNAKMRRVGVCGATESLLIDEAVSKEILPGIADALAKAGCEMRGDSAAQSCDKRIIVASEEDWSTEYLAPIISIKTVKDVHDAIHHINHYGSHHTDAIITDDKGTAREFLRRVDSAIVLHNASTQFADGGEFGFGGEIGISTGRLHARGPVGAEQLTTYKYVVHGEGQVRP